jgi:hypothetical protein
MSARYAAGVLLPGVPIRFPNLSLLLRRPRVRTIVTILVAAAIAATAFVYRFNTLGGRLGGFDNVHFIQLVRSIAVLDGERPLRDFTDTALVSLWPAPTYSSSAIAQRMLGRSLRSDALLTVGMLSLGAAALFWISSEFAAAILPAALLTLLAVALRPALYNYSKIVPYVIAIATMLAYARRPTMARLAALAGALAFAALYRHDYGVYIGVAAGTLVLLVHGRVGAKRPLLMLVAICVALLLPGIVFAQTQGGFVTYLRGCLEISRQEASRTAKPGAHFSVDWSQPLLVREDRPPSPVPRLAVRWTATLTPQMRQRAETELQLLDPIRRQDDWNWSYAILKPSPDHLAAIVHDTRVLDTDGIDRATFAVTDPPTRRGPRWIDELGGWRVAPGILRTDNAAPWLYFVAWSVVIFAIVCAMWPPLSGAMTTTNVPRPVVQAVSVLGVLMLIGLLRNVSASRLADVSVPVTILGSWLLSAFMRGLRQFPRPARYAGMACLTALVCITTLGVVVLNDVEHQMKVAGFTSMTRVYRQWETVWGDLGALPSALNGIDEDLRRASGYLRRCASPTDRLFVADNLPEIYYFAERGFAAGHNSFVSSFYSAPAFQRTAIERWERQSVPIALTPSDGRFEEEFSKDYSLLTDYLRMHYHTAGSLRVKADSVRDVWIDDRHSFASDTQTGLPCAQLQLARQQ